MKVDDNRSGMNGNTENIIRMEFLADGMHCGSCEKIIKRQIMKVDGVKDAAVDYATQEGWVEFDSSKTDIDAILDSVEEKDYSCKIIQKAAGESGPGFVSKHLKPAVLTLGLLVVLFGAYTMFESYFGTGLMPELGQTTSLILLFTVGLLTGFHCIGMCGGFVVSYASKGSIDDEQSGKRKSLHIGSHAKYGAGKMLSYTAIGALFGLIGSIFVFTPMIRGFAAILAGAFLIIFGINMLNIFPALRRVRIPQPGIFSKISPAGKGNGPLKIGLLNGLMIACGPLQALYIYAAGTGSVAQGAMALFAFGAGTLPVLFGFGLFASFVSKSMTHKILKISGVIVLVLGMAMLNRGLALTGTGYDVNSMVVSASFLSAGSSQAGPNGAITLTGDGYQEIRMEVNRYGWEPDKFLVKKGVPVRWIIDGKEVNYCNNAIQVPKLGLNFDIVSGEQVIEFTAEEEGVIPFSCWMGMIPGTIIVKDNIDLNDAAAVQKELDSVEVPQGGSCGGSCGSSTCGAARGGSCGCGGGR
jgi:sulfite exporter TauE/SafE/copper chaperone CopZ